MKPRNDVFIIPLYILNLVAFVSSWLMLITRKRKSVISPVIQDVKATTSAFVIIIFEHVSRAKSALADYVPKKASNLQSTRHIYYNYLKFTLEFGLEDLLRESVHASEQ